MPVAFGHRELHVSFGLGGGMLDGEILIWRKLEEEPRLFAQCEGRKQCVHMSTLAGAISYDLV